MRQRPEAIEAVLVDLLAGPCAQTGENGRRPLLLIIDDLEQILAANPAGPHRVRPEHGPVLAAVLRAFDPAETDSRLLSPAGSPSPSTGCRTGWLMCSCGLSRRWRRSSCSAASRPSPHPAWRAERAGLAARAVTVSRGNPGLQDLIGLKLVYGEHVALERAETAVAGMEAYLRQGDLPADGEVREFLENLALDTLLDEAGPANLALLRAATLFDLPVPEPVIGVLASQVGGSAGRLKA